MCFDDEWVASQCADAEQPGANSAVRAASSLATLLLPHVLREDGISLL